jgi:hypothetical protein
MRWPPTIGQGERRCADFNISHRTYGNKETYASRITIFFRSLLTPRCQQMSRRRLRLSSFWPPSHRTRDGSHRWLPSHRPPTLGPLHRPASKLRKGRQGSASERGLTNRPDDSARHSGLLHRVREKRTSSQRCERPEQNSRSNLGGVTMSPIEASPAGTVIR